MSVILGESQAEHFTHNKCQRMLKRLPLEIRNLIFAKDSHGRLQRVSEQNIVSRLNGRYDIATLTTYTILARESIYTQDWPLADFWSKHLFLVFLGLCRYLKLAGIGDAMLTIFESQIFSRTVIGAKRYRELPELFHNGWGASSLSGFKQRKSFIAGWAAGEFIPGRGISFDDCLRSLKLARKRSTNAYRGLSARFPNTTIQFPSLN